MQIQFWYCDFFSEYTDIKKSIEKIDNTILFKNISTDKVETGLISRKSTQRTQTKNQQT